MNLHRSKGPSGMSRRTLWIWGLVFLAAGVVGQCVILRAILGIADLQGDELTRWTEAASTSELGLEAVAFVLQAAGCCAIPVFAFLVTEGFLHTSSLKNYILRVAGLAVLAEIPYNLAMGGKWLVTTSLNPVFSVLLALVMLYLYRHYVGKTFKTIAIKVLIFVMAVLWASMLRIADTDGIVMIIMTSVFWFMRNKPQYRVFVCAMVMVLCCIVSPFCVVAPIAMIAIHFYNGEPGTGNRWVKYLAYPVMLLVIWAVATYGI